MSSESSPDFKSAFALLPQMLNISKSIQAKQNEPQKQQAQIQTAVAELQTQLQRCQQFLSTSPYLDNSPEQQQLSLEAKQEQLRHKCDLLLKYRNFEVLNLSTGNTSYPYSSTQ